MSPFTPPPDIKDTDILSEIQFQSVEPQQDGGVTWTSGQWSGAEVLAYLNQRQNRFIRDTRLFVSQDRLVRPANTLRIAMTDQLALPLEWIATVGLTWQDPTTLQMTPVGRGDSFQADHFLQNWRTVAGVKPVFYMDSDLPTLTLQVAPSVVAQGLLFIDFVALAGTLTGLGELFTVPDEFVAPIKYGTLADMFWKAGRAQNIEKAQYCEEKFEEGIAAANTMMTGW